MGFGATRGPQSLAGPQGEKWPSGLQPFGLAVQKVSPARLCARVGVIHIHTWALAGNLGLLPAALPDHVPGCSSWSCLTQAGWSRNSKPLVSPPACAQTWFTPPKPALFGSGSAQHLSCTARVVRAQMISGKLRLNSFCFDAKSCSPHPCPSSVLFCSVCFCSIPECGVAGGDNAAWLTSCTPYAWRRGSAGCSGPAVFMTKGVVLLIEVSCTEICACTSRNTCTVTFPAVSALLHRCCRNSVTARSRPSCCVRCAEMVGVHGGHCSGIFGNLSSQNCPTPSRQRAESGHGWGRPGAR